MWFLSPDKKILIESSSVHSFESSDGNIGVMICGVGKDNHIEIMCETEVNAVIKINAIANKITRGVKIVKLSEI